MPVDTSPQPVGKIDSGGFRVTPIFAPAYNPEMQFLVAGGVLLSWKAGPNPLEIQRSTLSSTISFSSTGAINVANTLTSFWFANRLRITADLAYKDMPDNYWGVGYTAGLEPTSGDSTTQYQREWFKFNPRAVWGVSGHLYVGGMLEWNHTIATAVNVHMAEDSAFLAGGSAINNVGLGLAIQYDSRDMAVNAYKGLYLAFNATGYGHYVGGDRSYQIYLLDYRQYLTLGRPGRTLAWTVKTKIGAHDVPWPELPLFGTSADIRGYVEGRFRDRSVLLGVVEYRYMFLRGNGHLSRHGFVVWTGGGSLGPQIQHLEGFLPNAGVGYRFELQPRSNIRMDAGFGKRSWGVYFNFTEAF
ncbi:MAG TPA: BamA/TamA family outer membrane protein [Gemmatimonadales bacterium]|nr:BamA/TamA family outer membrane protein [Gemmatimonadales bacterium]